MERFHLKAIWALVEVLTLAWKGVFSFIVFLKLKNENRVMNPAKWLLCWLDDEDRLGQNSGLSCSPILTRITCLLSISVQMELVQIKPAAKVKNHFTASQFSNA